MNKVAVIAAQRTPVGKIPGELNYIGETELLAQVFQITMKAFDKIIIDEAIVGSSFPIERDNLCRKAILMAGLSPKINAATVSKTCASSDEALAIACCKIISQNARTILVGSVEKISNSPYTLHFMKQNVKKSIKKDIPFFDEIKKNINENDMAYISEMLSRNYNITRQMQDAFTIESIKKAAAANKDGRFKNEIIQISYIKDNVEYLLSADEMLLYERIADDIQRAAPMFIKDGVLTQYNAAPMCDCAAAMLVMDYNEALRAGLKPLAVVHDVLAIGVSDGKRGHAMNECVQVILMRNNLSSLDIDLYEINESFAAQALFTVNTLRLDRSKVNVNGGNLALGYPIGATGLRMDITLIYEMIRRKSKYAISVMCAGGNMAQAVIFESVI